MVRCRAAFGEMMSWRLRLKMKRSEAVLSLSLPSQRQAHIPYRDSKLTRLLAPCLGGNSKTVMIVGLLAER